MINATKKTWMRTGFMMIAVMLAAAVACGAAPVKGKGGGKKSKAPLTPTTYDPRVSLAPLVEKVSESVVNIRTTSKMRQMPGMFNPGDLFEWFFGPRGHGQGPAPRPNPGHKQRSLGSGFIVDKSGLVVTNHHVVHGADEIEVQLSDDRTFTAELVGSDQRTDVAVLRLLDAKSLPTVRLGDSDKLKVGDHVVAIGNPFGLDHTVTSGIVSAKERVIGAGPYDDFIQTDASINPGNSGGPLFNLAGEVVGINTAIAPQGQGIGFAIPANMALTVIDALSQTGKVVRGWLGISFQTMDEKLAKAFGTKDKAGAVVAYVTSGSPADQGGMQSGDVIVEVNGKKLKEARQLPSLVAKLKPGKTASINVIRDGKPKKLKIKIGQLPDDLAGHSARPKAKKGKTELGFEVQSLDGRMKKRLGAENIDGVVVTGVNPGSTAARVLRSGDIIAEVNRDKVRNIAEFEAKIKGIGSGDDLLLLIFRRGAWQYSVLRL
ncbi:MAG: DegQ family serine endoprotease [Proteobacteria bacterium]|nr:DegQ family serine endoprotease [Pseudomonadota bacterium]